LFPFIDIVLMIVKSIPTVFFNPLFWLVIVLVWFQYQRSAKLEVKLYGREIHPARDKAISAIFFGVIGGIVGSFVLIFIGVSISDIGLAYVWMLAILFMMIHPRFLCFSYAGGIVSLSSLIFGFPNIDVAGLMAIVGILHFIEGILIYLSGYQEATPIFVKNERHGVVGGFTLQKFWPLPIVVLLTLTGQELPEEVIQMPDWWPLIRPIQQTENIIYVMFPVVAALGYGDIALAHSPREKSKKSAFYLFGFSSVLLLLAIIASRIKIFQYIAALFAPIAHDLIIHYGRNIEKKAPPMFVVPERGVRVLEVIPNSPAEAMGLKRGDVILSINGIPINTKQELNFFLSDYPTYVWLDCADNDGKYFSVDYKAYPDGLKFLGVILVPDSMEGAVTVEEKGGLLLRWLKNLFKSNRM